MEFAALEATARALGLAAIYSNFGRASPNSTEPILQVLSGLPATRQLHFNKHPIVNRTQNGPHGFWNVAKSP